MSKLSWGWGAGGGKRTHPQESLLAGYLFGGNWRFWRLSLLKDCRLNAPHSQKWPEYKLETASCLALDHSTTSSFLFSLPLFSVTPFITIYTEVKEGALSRGGGGDCVLCHDFIVKLQIKFNASRTFSLSFCCGDKKGIWLTCFNLVFLARLLGYLERHY